MVSLRACSDVVGHATYHVVSKWQQRSRPLLAIIKNAGLWHFSDLIFPWFLLKLWLYHRNNLFFPSFQVHSIQTYQRRDHQRHLLAGWMIFMDIRASKEEVSLLFYSEVSVHQHHLHRLCFCVSVHAFVQMTITRCTHRPLPTIPNLNKTEAHQCPTSGNSCRSSFY